MHLTEWYTVDFWQKGKSTELPGNLIYFTFLQARDNYKEVIHDYDKHSSMPQHWRTDIIFLSKTLRSFSVNALTNILMLL